MSKNTPKKEIKVGPVSENIGIKRRHLLLGSTSLVAASAFTAAALPRVADAATPDVLPKPELPFQGKIGRTLKDSTPDFPKGIEGYRGQRGSRTGVACDRSFAT